MGGAWPLTCDGLRLSSWFDQRRRRPGRPRRARAERVPSPRVPQSGKRVRRCVLLARWRNVCEQCNFGSCSSASVRKVEWVTLVYMTAIQRAHESLHGAIFTRCARRLLGIRLAELIVGCLVADGSIDPVPRQVGEIACAIRHLLHGRCRRPPAALVLQLGLQLCTARRHQGPAHAPACARVSRRPALSGASKAASPSLRRTQGVRGPERHDNCAR